MPQQRGGRALLLTTTGSSAGPSMRARRRVAVLAFENRQRLGRRQRRRQRRRPSSVRRPRRRAHGRQRRAASAAAPTRGATSRARATPLDRPRAWSSTVAAPCSALLPVECGTRRSRSFAISSFCARKSATPNCASCEISMAAQLGASLRLARRRGRTRAGPLADEGPHSAKAPMRRAPPRRRPGAIMSQIILEDAPPRPASYSPSTPRSSLLHR